MKSVVIALLVSLLSATLANAQNQQPESFRKLPPDIAGFLDKKYPGWKFAPLTGRDVSCYDTDVKAHPALASGDFNADGKTDFAVEIVHGGSIYAIEFLSKGSSFATLVLFKRPDGKRFGGPLVAEKKGKKNSVGMVEPVDSLAVGDCGDVPARYVFRNGRIKDESPRD